MKRILLLFVLVLGLQQVSYAQKTLKVWIVRHAEKDLSDSNDPDPDLTSAGFERADALMKVLKGQKIDSIFSTNYKRTKLTGFPLADRIGLVITPYVQAEATAFVNQLKANAAGKNVLIIGHSNTILELIEAFGLKRPLPTIPDDEYDHIFALTIKGDKIEVRSATYGVKSNK